MYKEIDSLKDTVELMLSSDWKERLVAEYLQTRIRYLNLLQYRRKVYAKFTPKPPNRSLIAEYEILERQKRFMRDYLRILELRLSKECGINVGTDD